MALIDDRSPVEQPLKQSHLRAESNLKALDQVLHWFEQFVSPLLPYDLWWQCQIALTEGFTNAVRHAHHALPPNTPIDLEVQIFSCYLEMRIWDRGEPFNLLEKLQTLYQQSGNPLEKESGRGLIFMHQLTDELWYTRMSDDRNCLVMRKKIER